MHVFTVSWCNCLRSLLNLSPCTPLNKITAQSHSVFVPPTALTDQSNKYDWVHWVNNRLHYSIICTYNKGQLMHILLVIHMRHASNTKTTSRCKQNAWGYETLLAILRSLPIGQCNITCHTSSQASHWSVGNGGNSPRHPPPTLSGN